MNQDNEFNNETFGGQQNFNDAPPQTTYVTYIPYGLTPETFEERKKIKKTALTIGGSLLAMLAIPYLFSLVSSFSLIFLSISGADIYSYFNDAAVKQVLQIVISSIMFTLPFIIFFKCSGYRISDLVSFKKPQKQDILPLLLFGISFCAFANMAVSIARQFFSNLGIDYEVDFGEKPEGFFGFLLTLIATSVVPALVEEFAFRGFVLGSLRKFGDGFAIIASSIVFGIMHGNFQQIPFAFLVGLVLAYITVKSDTLWIAVAVHAFNNFISVFIEYALNGVTQNFQNVFYTVFLCVSLLLGFVAVYLLKNRDDAYNLQGEKTKSSEKQKYKWFFESATIIIFTIISVIEALAFFK